MKIDEAINKVVIGYLDGKFRLDRTVSRAEFAKILSSFTQALSQKWLKNHLFLCNCLIVVKSVVEIILGIMSF